MGLGSTTVPLRRELELSLPERPFTVRFWDGTEVPATSPDPGAPTFTVRSPRALGHALRAPGQIGLGRAYVTGELDVDDLDSLLGVLTRWQPPPLDGAAKRRLAIGAARAAGLMLLPAAPDAELRPRGLRHSPERDARAVRHHYDVSNDFFALFLGPTLTYSCAVFGSEDEPLDAAQERKLELVCTKLALQPGMRVLDVGCGWGSFALHAAARHGVDVVGITLSEPQARRARERVAEAGLAGRIDIRVQDYRELGGDRFDAIASIGMVEHVGARQIDLYARTLADLLEPGGQLLNHGIARLRHTDAEAGGFSERYVFPDAAPLHLSRIQYALERAGLATEHVEGFAEHYARTLTHWAQRLDASLDEARRLAGAERVRVWRLYLRTARHGFESGFMSVYQVRSRRPAATAG